MKKRLDRFKKLVVYYKYLEIGGFMNRQKQEQEMMGIFNQLSASGRVDVLAHTNTVLKAEKGIKKEYGIDGKKGTAQKQRRRQPA